MALLVRKALSPKWYPRVIEVSDSWYKYLQHSKWAHSQSIFLTNAGDMVLYHVSTKDVPKENIRYDHRLSSYELGSGFYMMCTYEGALAMWNIQCNPRTRRYCDTVNVYHARGDALLYSPVGSSFVTKYGGQFLANTLAAVDSLTYIGYVFKPNLSRFLFKHEYLCLCHYEPV